MKKSVNLGISIKFSHQEIESYKTVDIVKHKKQQELHRLPGLIINEMGDVYSQVESFNPQILEYQAELTVIKTEELRKIRDMIDVGKVVRLDELRMAFDRLIMGGM